MKYASSLVMASLCVVAAIAALSAPPTLPVITNVPPAYIDSRGAELGAFLVTNGGDEATAIWVCAGTNDGGTNIASWELVNGADVSTNKYYDKGTNCIYYFTAPLPATTYFYTFFASNLAGIGWASPSVEWMTTADEGLGILGIAPFDMNIIKGCE